MVKEIINSGKTSTNTEIVGDFTIFDRDVVVDADEDDFVFNI